MQGLSLGNEATSPIPLDLVLNNTPTSRGRMNNRRVPLRQVGNHHQAHSKGRAGDHGGNDPNSRSNNNQQNSNGQKVTVLSPPTSTQKNSSFSGSAIADGRRKAALRIKAKMKEDERLGIRRRKRQTKEQVGFLRLHSSLSLSC